MRDLPSARWAADPYGRHEMRYWDGAAWTAHVSDQGVTGTDVVPGLAAGVAGAGDAAPAGLLGEVTAADPSLDLTAVLTGAAAADGATVLLPSEAPASSVGPDDLTVTLPTTSAGAAPLAAPVLAGGPVGQAGTGYPAAAGAPGVDAFFGATPVSAKSGGHGGGAPTKPRTGLVAAVAGLAIVGIAAGVVGFSGLPGSGRTGGSGDVVPVAAPPTSASTTEDVAPETATDDPVATTTYGGPTTSAAVTTSTARTTTTKPRTSTSTPPTTKTSTSTSSTTTGPATSPPDQFKAYASCQAMHQDYPHGVGLPGARDRTQGGAQRVRDFYVSRPLYFINAQLDVDGDGIACEA